MPEPIRRWIITPHAWREATRRGIPVDVIQLVVNRPEQRLWVRSGRLVHQRRVQFGYRMYLVRAFIDVDREPNEVVTVYRSSKIAKYWRIEP